MELTLAEQLLLLSYDDVTGKPRVNTHYLDYAIAGALLLELAYAGRLTEHSGMLQVASSAPIGDPVADPVLAYMAAQRGTHTANWWVYRLSTDEHRTQMLDRLVGLGVLERREQRLLIFRRSAFPEVDPTDERALAQHLRDVVSGAAEPDQRSVGLIALAHACELDRQIFADSDRDDLRHRINALIEGDWCGVAVRKVINAMNMAVLAAVSGGVVQSREPGLDEQSRRPVYWDSPGTT